jgi:hypothetical protein
MIPEARGRENAARALYRAEAGGHEDEMLLVELLDRQQRVDLLAIFERRQVHVSLPRAGPARRSEDLQPVDLAAIGKHSGVSCVGDEEFLGEISSLTAVANLPRPPRRCAW